MNQCPHMTEVVEAHRAGRLDDEPALFAHLDTCPSCTRAVTRAAIDAALAEPFGASPARGAYARLDENTAAMIAAGLIEPPAPGTLSPADEARLAKVIASLAHAEALDEPLETLDEPLEALDEPLEWLDEPVRGVDAPVEPERRALGGGAAVAVVGHPEEQVGAEVVSLDTARRRRWWWATAGLVSLAATAALFIQPMTVSMAHDAGVSRLEARNGRATLDLFVGGKQCGAAERVVSPCAWTTSRETVDMFYLLEPKATTRYLVVLARDAEDGITVLYPSDAHQSPLDVTRGCKNGLCWLEGGRYDAPPGRVDLVAVFSVEPLDPTELAAQWAPDTWKAMGVVERFTLEARKDPN